MFSNANFDGMPAKLRLPILITFAFQYLPTCNRMDRSETNS